MKKILFLHGFYASGQCVPAVALREAVAGRAEVITPDLPMHPKKAVRFIRELIEVEHPDLTGAMMKIMAMPRWVKADCRMPVLASTSS